MSLDPDWLPIWTWLRRGLSLGFYSSNSGTEGSWVRLQLLEVWENVPPRVPDLGLLQTVEPRPWYIPVAIFYWFQLYAQIDFITSQSGGQRILPWTWQGVRPLFDVDDGTKGDFISSCSETKPFRVVKSEGSLDIVIIGWGWRWFCEEYRLVSYSEGAGPLTFEVGQLIREVVAELD